MGQTRISYLQLLCWCTLLGILTCQTKADVPLSAPSFINKPKNITAEEFDSITFRCKVTGNPAPKMRWLKNGVYVKKDPRHAIGSILQYLYIRPVLQSDTGARITCEAKNTIGTITADAYLVILKDIPPTWVERPHDVILHAGQEYTMSCKARGYPNPTYQWYKGSMRASWTSVTILELSNGKLYFSSASYSEQGDYQCKARNNWGVISTKANVKVVKDPSVLIHPNDTMGVFGDVAWLQCGMIGNTMTSLVWMKNGKKIDIPLGSRKSVDIKTLPNTMRIYTLTIRKAAKEDAGKYKCVASNINGISASNEATLNFTDSIAAPIVTVMQGNLTVAKDLDVVLNCFFTGIPLPVVTWYRNGQKLPQGGAVKETSKSSLVASLEIQEVVDEDDGVYACEGKNLAGSASGAITLMVKGPPGIPTDLIANLTSDTTIKVSWNPGYDGGAIVRYVLEYKRNSSTWTTVEIGTNTTVTLTSKDGWRMTVFRVWASNLYGSSPSPSAEYKVHIKEKDISTNKEKGRPPPRSSPQSSGAVIGGAIGGVLLLILVVLILLVFLWRRRQAKYMHSSLQTSHSVRYTTAQREDEDGSRYDYVTVRQDASVDPQAAAAASQYDSLGKPINWEVPKRSLTLGKELGKGHFGKVVRAVMKTRGGSTVVAVKMLKEKVDPVAKKDFLAELELMKSLAPHPNIVGLMGCCTKGDSSYIIVEFCSLGNLLEFLRNSQGNRIYSNLAGGSLTLTCRDLLSFMWQIARGMSYLASLKLVHRDLAARNILVDKGNVCKIADFGLARDIYQENQYLKTTEGELPLRWMACESIFKGITTIESDVWSFGVLMWEIVTLGGNPYPGMTREQLISNLHLGYRMPRPPYCSEELYQVIWECWKQDPAVRPTFSMLCRTLNRMLAAEKILIDLSTFDSDYINANNADDEGPPESPKSPLVT